MLNARFRATGCATSVTGWGWAPTRWRESSCSGTLGFIWAFAFHAPGYDAVLAGTHSASQVDRWPLVAAPCRESGIEELHYTERIARLRAYYFDFAPELTHYLASVPPSRRLAILGLHSGYWPALRTTAGMIGMVTAVLTGSAAGLLAAIAAGHSAIAGFVTGGVVGAAVLATLMWYQLSAWVQAHRQRLFEDEQERPDAG